MIHYLRGDATRPELRGPKVIAHVCNNKGGWGKGFVLALSRRWPEVEASYRRWYKNGKGFELGAIQIVQVTPEIWVANMIAQDGYASSSNPTPLQYPALRKCLEHVAIEAGGFSATVHIPKIGTGLAGGDWALIEPLLEETLAKRHVYVYTLE